MKKDRSRTLIGYSLCNHTSFTQSFETYLDDCLSLSFNDPTQASAIAIATPDWGFQPLDPTCVVGATYVSIPSPFNPRIAV